MTIISTKPLLTYKSEIYHQTFPSKLKIQIDCSDPITNETLFSAQISINKKLNPQLLQESISSQLNELVDNFLD